MTLRELSDSLLSLLENNESLDDCEVYIHNGEESRHLCSLQLGYSSDDMIIPEEFQLEKYTDENSQIEHCVILFDHEDDEEEIEEEEVRPSLISLLGFIKK